MRILANKLRVIYLPFLLIVVGFLIGYSFLNWLLLIDLDLFTLDDEVVNLWLPMGLSALALFIWMRPRLKALQARKRGHTDIRGLFWFMSWIAVAGPTMIGQFYLETATGKLTHLTQIGDINQLPRTKYYTVRDAFFDKADASYATTAHYSARYNTSFDMALYLACPIESYAGNPSPGNVWLGTDYKYQISSSLSEDEKKAQFETFVSQSLRIYNNQQLHKFSYLERLGSSEDSRGFETAIKRSKLYQPETPIIVLECHTGDFSDRNGDKLAWVFGSLGIGAAVCFLVLLAAPVDQPAMNRLLAGKRPKDEAPNAAWMFFLPNRVAIVTPLLIDANIVVFVCMVLAGLGIVSFDSYALLAWGGNFRPAVLNGEVWRLVSSMFVHGGLMHLAVNLVMLYLVGMMLELILGHWRFLICYFLCGIAGSVASVAWHPDTVSVGASGAIMGALGVLIGIAIIQQEKNPKQKNDLLKIALFIAGYNLLTGFVMTGVDNADHLGGLACGLILGVLFGTFPGLRGQGLAPRSPHA